MRVIRSAGQNVSPSDDGRLYDQIFTDGLFEDATVTALGGNNIALSALYGVICGRDFTAEAQTINATLPEADTASGYIYVEIDTSSDDIITIGTALAPFTPTYENINTNGAVAQMVIATYEASAVAVTSVTATYAKASAGGVGSLATIEASPATSNYSVGSFLVYNGTLYKVTRAIAAGEALVVGTNISATTVGAELTSLNNGLFIRKSNTISVNVSSGAGGTVNYSYPTAMPAGYEPISRCFMRTDSGGYGVIVVCPLYQNYINYYSTGSAPNPMTGYVVELCAKTNMYR